MLGNSLDGRLSGTVATDTGVYLLLSTGFPSDVASFGLKETLHLEGSLVISKYLGDFLITRNILKVEATGA